MIKKDYYSFVKSHNLVNRIYDMLIYLKVFENKNYDELVIKRKIKNKLKSIYYVETLAKYFEIKKRKNKKNIDLRCNLNDLINDLNYLKQYLN